MSNGKNEDDQQFNVLAMGIFHASEELTTIVGGDRSLMLNGMLHAFALALSFGDNAAEVQASAKQFADGVEKHALRYFNTTKGVKDAENIGLAERLDP